MGRKKAKNLAFTNSAPYLPTEVLCKIFHICLPEFPDLTEYGDLMVPSQLEAPILLTGVCRRWREITVGTPSLWCKLSLQAYSEEEEEWQERALGYDLWLKRSQGYPLSLALDCYEDNAARLRVLLQPYISQISSLCINIDSEAEEPELMLKDLTMLQELIMCTSAVPLAELISHLPSTLGILHVRRFHHDTLLFNHHLITSCNPYFHLLQLAPDLSSLSICISISKIEALKPFMHTRLQSLRIKGYTPHTRLSDLFDALSLPNLRILEVYNASPLASSGIQGLLGTIKASFGELVVGFWSGNNRGAAIRIQGPYSFS
ncbi:hypothetical protein DFJ58DRAFT_737374 [Suillus subalutaceus]|uniref:uncharacterized protein n=1 Tax=Suillus subalutaceus TaxID=48586 RepID=UPI001B87119F|nr:uncharacterized protein DFJ58DRAFT_737374 [Suillus subalutaceus]KAG1829381.1 hypothetical protein DFJ58DRAFT_737374 [Suillus subalutaceus]